MRYAMRCGISAAAGSAATLLFLVFAGDTESTHGALESSRSVPVGASAAANPAAQQSNVKVDNSNARAEYVNFARVTATPEEVILDMALNPQPFAPGEQQLRVSHQVVMTFYTAKRLQGALEATIQRHENAFGPIELDARKRARPGAKDQ